MQWTRPKSVRQIGEIPGRGRIYMEDYVIRFVKRLAEQSHGMEKAAVLLGASLICDGEKIYQISGVVEIHNFAGRSGPKFTDEDWDYHLFGNEGKFYGFGNCRMVLQLSGIFC